MKSFYWYFRPLALFAKLIGVFPLKNVLSGDPTKLSFKFISLDNLYSIVIFGFYMGMIYYFSGFVNVQTATLFQKCVMCSVLLRSCLSFGFVSRHSRKLPELIKLLDRFDRKKSKVLLVKFSKWYINLLLWTILPSIFMVLVLIATFCNYSQLYIAVVPKDNQQMIDGYVVSMSFGFLSIWQTLPIMSYMYFGWKIRCSFKEINTTIKLRQYCGCFFEEHKKYDDSMSMILKNIRFLHNMLSKCVNELGQCYGGYLAMEHAFIILVIIINIGAYIYSINHDISLLIITAIHATLFFLAVIVSDEIQEKVSFEIIKFAFINHIIL